MSTFGQNLKELRTQRSLTQSEFGALFNLSKQTISGYEKGEASPPIETLLKFADFFNVTTDYLLGRDTIDVNVLHTLGMAAAEAMPKSEKEEAALARLREMSIGEQQLRILNKFKSLPEDHQKAIEKIIDLIDPSQR